MFTVASKEDPFANVRHQVQDNKAPLAKSAQSPSDKNRQVTKSSLLGLKRPSHDGVQANQYSESSRPAISGLGEVKATKTVAFSQPISDHHMDDSLMMMISRDEDAQRPVFPQPSRITPSVDSNHVPFSGFKNLLDSFPDDSNDAIVVSKKPDTDPKWRGSAPMGAVQNAFQRLTSASSSKTTTAGSNQLLGKISSLLTQTWEQGKSVIAANTSSNSVTNKPNTGIRAAVVPAGTQQTRLTGEQVLSCIEKSLAAVKLPANGDGFVLFVSCVAAVLIVLAFLRFQL